MRKSRSNV